MHDLKSMNKSETMTKKLIAGVVLYNPSEENIKWINSILKAKLFSEFVIYDNSKDRYKDQFNLDTITYYSSGKNDGLAKAYNFMIELAIKDDMDFLCLLDQDSEYEIEEIIKMIDFLNSNHDFSQAAIVAPRSYPYNSKNTHQRSEETRSVNFAINSGSFLNIPVVSKANLRYDEKVFLDGVDYEFGWQIREAGYQTLIYEGSIFYQKLGYLANEDDSFYHHTKYRYYLIAKNRKYIYRKHKGMVLGSIISFVKNVYLITEILKNEDDKADKAASCLRGIVS